MEIVDMEGGVSEHARPCHWLLLCREIAMGTAGGGRDSVTEGSNGDDGGDDDDDEDGDGGSGAGKEEEQGGRYSIWAKARRDASLLVADLPPIRWQGKMVAAQCVRQVLNLVGSVPEHFDVEKARKVIDSCVKNRTQ